MKQAYRDKVRNHLLGWGRSLSGSNRLVDAYFVYIDDAERMGADAEVVADFLHWKDPGNASLTGRREYQALTEVPYVWNVSCSRTNQSGEPQRRVRSSA